MCTFTRPIKYADQDFDEYQAGLSELGQQHVEWLRNEATPAQRGSRIMGAWFCNDLNKQNAYLAVYRWHNLAYSI